MRGTAQCSLRVRTLSSNGLRGSWQDWYREVLVQVGIAEAICTNAHLGFRGMRERVSQLGGNLTIESNSGATTVVATFPISNAAAASNEELGVA